MLRIEFLADARLQAKALQAGACEDDGLVVTVIHSSEAGSDVSAQGIDYYVRAQCEQLGLPAQAGAADYRTLR